MLIIIAIALAAFVFFQFRNSRKRQRETAERQTQMVPGVEIMTNYGLYGTILSVDEDTNVALIETDAGTVLKSTARPSSRWSSRTSRSRRRGRRGRERAGNTDAGTATSRNSVSAPMRRQPTCPEPAKKTHE